MQGDCQSRDTRAALSRNLFASDWAVATFWVILPRAEQIGTPAASSMPDMPMIATAIVVLRPNLSIALVDRVIGPTRKNQLRLKPICHKLFVLPLR